jgi:hypothetical protein
MIRFWAGVLAATVGVFVSTYTRADAQVLPNLNTPPGPEMGLLASETSNILTEGLLERARPRLGCGRLQPHQRKGRPSVSSGSLFASLEIAWGFEAASAPQVNQDVCDTTWHCGSAPQCDPHTECSTDWSSCEVNLRTGYRGCQSVWVCPSCRPLLLPKPPRISRSEIRR